MLGIRLHKRGKMQTLWIVLILFIALLGAGVIVLLAQ